MGEFDLIRKIQDSVKNLPAEVKVGIGDDAAVIDRGDFYELITQDMLVENDHFRLDWSSAYEIGWKSMQVSISDIAAMSGRPKYAFVSLCLSEKVDESWVLELYRGMQASGMINILGGDITHGANVVVDVCLIGEVEKDRLVLRSGARGGDLICVTGTLGASWAGLEYLRSGLQDFGADFVQYCLEKHRKPLARVECGRILSKYASAMIDVSDGLASEVRHIAENSAVGALVEREKIPLDERVMQMAKVLNKDPYFWALSGGEDFELVFTLDRNSLPLLKKHFPVYIVGEIVEQSRGIRLINQGEDVEMPSGFEHFVKT